MGTYSYLPQIFNYTCSVKTNSFHCSKEEPVSAAPWHFINVAVTVSCLVIKYYSAHNVVKYKNKKMKIKSRRKWINIDLSTSALSHSIQPDTYEINFARKCAISFRNRPADPIGGRKILATERHTPLTSRSSKEDISARSTSGWSFTARKSWCTSASSPPTATPERCTSK